jgi:hypothetical protein
MGAALVWVVVAQVWGGCGSGMKWVWLRYGVVVVQVWAECD